MSERQVWAIRVVIEATDEQAEAAEQAIARALCPDENHPGSCETPWTTIRCVLTDLDDDERAAWQVDFDEDRRRAREAGEIDP
jgi:hypothetical protein